VNNCQQIVKLFWRFTVGFCRNKVAHNVKVFMKKGEFGTRQPVTGAGFCSNVELLPTAS
jgi:hypothetical protein